MTLIPFIALRAEAVKAKVLDMIKIASHCTEQGRHIAPPCRYDIMLLKLCSLTLLMKGISLTPMSNLLLANDSWSPIL